MKTEILNKLNEFETQYNVKILYACESGSRAWGFESKDSDYDIRFIYTNNLDWYLDTKIGYHKFSDVIEFMDKDNNLDFSGWDLKKTINLFKKGNPHLFEYIRSPVVYVDKAGMSDFFKTAGKLFFSEKSSVYHYLHMAQNNFNRYLVDDEISLKKYLYVLRPILCCKWIENKTGPPPVKFDVLFDEFIESKSLRFQIDELLKKKRSGNEMDKGKRIDILHDYLDLQIMYFSRQVENITNQVSKDEKMKQHDLLNSFFKETLFSLDKI